MTLVSIQNLSKYYGARALFEGANLQVAAGSRYGVVGANGSGKSTLLRVVSGEEEATGGEVAIPKRVRVGVLEQDHFQYEHERIIDVVMMGIPELWGAMVEKEKILERAHESFDADRYAELEDVVLRFDGYTIEARAAEVLEGLGILAAQHELPLSTLSGGFKLRVLLAQLLTANPDVLLLDEPTNHLDIASIKWLEGFLLGFAGAAMIVSHDRRFLDTVCTHIVDVDYELVTTYKGDYASFERQKADLRERKEAEIERREQEIADHKAFIDRFKAKATKARQAKSKAKMMERIEIEELPPSSRRYPNFKFKQVRPSGKEVVKAEGIHKSYGDKVVLDGVDLTVDRGDRVAIIGPNGVGKSTLLKILIGELDADAGEVEWGYETHPGYFSQGHDAIHGAEEHSIHDWLWDTCPGKPTGFVRGKLAEVLFSKDEVFKKIGALSGGEAARAIFAKLSIEEPNVLVLDEPTNHLDLEGIESLAEGLAAYDGTILFVSHDRWFVRQLATRIFEITPGGVDDFPGGYDAFLDKVGRDHLEA
jgi:ATPase subunit of ABC transporter with duplicated ATPase domains